MYPDSLYFDLLLSDVYEHFIYYELYSYSAYSELNFPITYWRTSSQIEVNFVIGNQEVAIEVKSTQHVNTRHLKGLEKFAEEYIQEN